MGISVEQYLHNRQACAQCQEHGDEEHCVTTLLSREDNCIFYNSVLAYHLPTRTKTTPFTPDEQNAAAQADFALLQAFREYINEDKMVEYYVQAEKIVTQIRGIHQNDRSIWKGYYERYVRDILDALRNDNKSAAVVKTVEMLEALEYTNGRVICTWLRNNGLFSAKDLAIDTEFSVQYLSDNTKIGYWLWACPLVEHMERNYRNNTDSLFIKAIRIIAQARANEIAYQTGARTNSDFLGKIVRIVGESACFVLGSIARPFIEEKFKHWLAIYSTKIR
jgi:hypothetical protein